MCVCKVMIFLVFVLSPATKVNGNPSEKRMADTSFSGIAFEIILTKLEYLEEKLVNMEALHAESEVAQKEFRDTIDQKLTHQEELLGGLQSSVNRIDQRYTLQQTRLESALKEFRIIIEQQRSHHENSSTELMTKMDQSFTTLHVQSKVDQESLGHKLQRIDETTNTMNTILHGKFSVIQTQSEQKDNVKLSQLQGENLMPSSKDNLVRPTSDPNLDYADASISSCTQVPWMQSGIYYIQPIGYFESFSGYCAQDTFEGGWLVVQYRFNGSEDFNRGWTEYRNGFGYMDGEFWLGLEHLHRLTSTKPHELLVELKDFEGVYKYARYSEFQIGSEHEGYFLKKLGSYTGTAGDSFEYNGAKFSTKDRNNDISKARSIPYVWWSHGDSYANLNGIYKKSDGYSRNAMYWYDFKKFDGLAYSRMMIREI